MINFLHTFQPDPILISLGPINIYWYGLFIVSGILASMLVIMKLAGHYNLEKEKIIDIGFWIILAGVLGARLYHLGLKFSYYWDHPVKLFKIWEGGLAIHGAMLFGGLSAWYLVKKNNINFWQLASIVAPGLSLAQTIGRWGNYFNQELYGLPTSLPWGIPIEPQNRILEYFSHTYFHPTFLYESIGSFLIFVTLILIHVWIIKNKKFNNFCYLLLVTCYLILYSLLRFSLEFIRIDLTPTFLGLRFPQIISLLIIFISLIFLYRNWRKQRGLKNI